MEKIKVRDFDKTILRFAPREKRHLQAYCALVLRSQNEVLREAVRRLEFGDQLLPLE